jgi:SAM-dependent methyltransferase
MFSLTEERHPMLSVDYQRELDTESTMERTQPRGRMLEMNPYTEDYYKNQQRGSLQSAREIVPLVVKLIQPNSVIDVGCGVGTWLSVFRECGVEDIWGIDGAYINKKMLKIPEERFLSFDTKKPFRMDRQFDLVVSMEVAEHLPAECAETFIASLISLGPIILFSAAIPFQGGTQHVNEQWQEYWAQHFQEKGYVAVDCIRKLIWHNDNVLWFYAQNTLMYVRQDYLEKHAVLKREFEITSTSQISIVHPKALSHMSLGRLLSLLPIVTKNAFKKRIKRRLVRRKGV